MKNSLNAALLLALSSVLLLLCAPSQALAAGLTLTADSTALRVGSSTQIHVQVQGGQIDAAPRLVKSEGFDIEMAGRSSSFTMRQGRVSQQTTYSFTVIAREPGKRTLGPAEALVDGKRVISQPLEIEVLAAGSAKRSTASQGGDGEPNEHRWFAHAQLTDDTPFEGENISYILEVGTAVSVRGTRWNRPSWGSLSPAPGVEPQQSDRLEVLDGRRYEVTTLVMPLFALEAGATRIDPSIMDFTVPTRARSFFDLGAGQQFQHSSEALELRVMPLPKAGRPANFSGAVGRFQLSASIDRNRLNAGETATLVLRLSGSGGLHKPEIDLQLPATIRRYSEQPEQISKMIGRTLRTELTLREALVPLEPGTITIPPISFSYFDPSDEQYRTASSAAIQLHVGGTAVIDPAVVARSAELGQAKEAVEVLGSDILGLHSAELSRGDRRLSLRSAGILLALFLPLFCFSSVATVVTRRKMSGTSAGQARERNRKAKMAHRELQASAASGDLAAAEAAWRSYLSARTNRPGEALSPADAQDTLLTAGTPPSLVGEVASLLEALEAVRYGGASDDDLAEKMAAWTDRAAKEWK